MKGVNVALLITSILIVIVTAGATITYVDFIMDTTQPPLGLSSDFSGLNVPNIRLQNHEQRAEFMDALYNLVKDKEITLVRGWRGAPIGLYDTRGTYIDYAPQAGAFISPEIEDTILIRENSYAHQTIIEDTYTIGDTEFEVIGIYDHNHPLADAPDGEYIYNLFHPQYIVENHVSGAYFIDSPDEELKVEIRRLFERSDATILNVASGKTLEQATREFIFGTEDLYSDNLTLFWGLAVAYLAYSILLYNIVRTHQRIAAISLYFGATKFRFFLHFSKRMFFWVALGTVIGVGLYNLVALNFAGTLLVGIWAGVAIIIPLVLATLLLTLAFALTKFQLKEGEPV